MEWPPDRFRLLKNLRERIKDLMDRRHSFLPEVEEKRTDAIPAKAQGIKGEPAQKITELQAELPTEKHYRAIPPTPYQRPAGMSYSQFQKQVRRDRRYARYEDVQMLSKQGIGIREIARRLKLSRQTVRRLVRAEEFPEMPPSRRGQKGSILNQYKPYIFQRWQQGCRNSVQLYDEIKAHGYSGSTSLLRNFLAEVRKKHVEAGSADVLTLDAENLHIERPPLLNWNELTTGYEIRQFLLACD